VSVSWRKEKVPVLRTEKILLRRWRQNVPPKTSISTFHTTPDNAHYYFFNRATFLRELANVINMTGI
jgi:hypothetical protein